MKTAFASLAALAATLTFGQATQAQNERFNAAFLPVEQAHTNAAPENISYEERVYQAFETLKKDPASSIDLEAIRRMAMDEGLEKDPELRACAYAAYAVSLAMQGENADYIRLFESFSKQFTNEVVTAQINPQNLTGACPQCRGQNSRTVRCMVCNNGRCKKCLGSGKITARPSMSARSTLTPAAAAQTPCAQCSGTGKCQVCAATRVNCEACGNSGIAPDAGKMREVFYNLAESGEKRSFQRVEHDLKERAASIAVMRIVAQAKRTRDPKKAAELLQLLPSQYPEAPEIPPLIDTIGLLQADAAERDYNAPNRVRLRENVKNAIQQAQSARNVDDGIGQLREAQERFAAADNASDLAVALEGLEKERARRNEEASKNVSEALARIEKIDDLDIALEQLDFLQKSTDNEAQKARVKNARLNLEIKLNQKKKEQRQFFIAGGIAGGILLAVGFFAFSIQQQIRQRKRKQRAAAQNRFPFRIPPSDSDPFSKKK